VMCSPKVSVIIPVYNVEQYLMQCVKSVLAQTYDNIEVLLIDDGSLDHSGELCDTLAQQDSRIRVYHKLNGGLSDARNYGLDHCVGAYISFIDSDDWIADDMIEHLMNALLQNEADIAICGYVKAYKNIKIFQNLKDQKLKRNEALEKLLTNTEFQDHVWTMLYRSELWSDIRFPVGKYYEDIRTNYKLFLKADTIVTIATSPYYYRQRGNSIVKGTFRDYRFQQLEAVNDLLKVPEFEKDSKLSKIIRQRIIRARGYILQDLLRNGTKEDCRKNERFIYTTGKIYRRNFLSIIRDKNYYKSLKFLACMSFLGDHLMRLIYRYGPLAMYFDKKYVTY